MANPDLNKTAKNNNVPISSAHALELVFEFGVAIVIPLVVGLGIGKWLDHTYGVNYWKYIGLMVAFLSSTVWSFVMIRRLNREYQTDLKELQTKNSKPQK